MLGGTVRIATCTTKRICQHLHSVPTIGRELPRTGRTERSKLSAIPMRDTGRLIGPHFPSQSAGHAPKRPFTVAWRNNHFFQPLFADRARLSKAGDFIRWHCSSKFGRGPFQQRSSTASKTGTSSRKVARVRNRRASFHELNSDSDSKRDLRIEGCH